ncbi:metallophosphoesterase [Eikenella sp. S3360]|uniref:Metallophosphoesterase n=1 Tax=Eikenella glucosivorans TaxID=2766967 RepID=A0ABS0NCN6_9NEIS|nr:metallophosphoesterase [Eikenella glucosivorans]MBH5330073.1 metallophosphoesterase [Eikenella glucosivorans]
MPYQYRQTLPHTPLDIIGDVHGEFAAFQSLLHHLGYHDDGRHPQGRRLVFVGDLCDRGPDSPAMLAWFKQAHERGFAQMVLGNHELNLLANDPKDGAGWFFDSRADKDAANYTPWQRQAADQKTALTSWLAEQPLLLERPDLRIVHAAWLPQHIEHLEAAQGEGLVEQYRRFDAELDYRIRTAPWYADYCYEQEHYAPLAHNPHQAPPPMPATAQYDFERSRLNPIRALTSGVERLADAPFFAGGRWRGTTRCPWWDDYHAHTPVIIGHYWRSWQPHPAALPAERGLLPPQPDSWHGARHNVFCVDFSIGASWRARKHPQQYQPEQFRLAALRWPERELVFNNGEHVPTR